MKSNRELVNHLQYTNYINSDSVREAFLKIDRKYFVPEDVEEAYEDRPLPIGQSQTISAPSVVAFMLEKLELKKGDKVLEVGTGSGYNAALLSCLVGPKGQVITIDRFSELIELAKSNIENCPNTFDNIKFVTGDGSKGYPDSAPYNGIVVTGAIPSLDIDHPLVAQLKRNGRTIAPVGDVYGQNLVLYKQEFHSFEDVLPVVFVPIIGEYGFKI